MKHAYLIQAHGNYAQLSVLLHMLDDVRNDIFVHIDARSGDFPREDLTCSKAGLYFTDRIPVRWGGPSQIWSELILLKEAAARGSYAYYHLLSGADLPIKSQDYIHDFFDAHQGTEFVSFWRLKKSTASRWLWSPFAEYGRNFAGNLINNLFKAVQLLVRRVPFPGVDYRYGPNWFSITDDLARYVISKEEWIRKVFSHCCNCDELFLQTLVWNSEFKQKCFSSEEAQSGAINMANVRLVDWSRGSSVRHPWTFVSDDYDMLSSAEHLFARKFDAGVDKDIIDRIAGEFA